jgi:hypothetical protein
VNAAETKSIVIIGDSFIALEFCGWLTTGLPEKKNVEVVMRAKTPMSRACDENMNRTETIFDLLF